MAQDDLIFKEKVAFKPAQISGAYTPVQAPDITPQMEKNRDILSKNMKDHADAVRKQLDAENEAKKLADDNNVQALSKFSNTLTGLVKMGGEMWQEAEEREIEMWALNNAPELLKSITKTKVNEAKAIEGQVATDSAANIVEEEGGSSDVVQKFRDLGGFRKVHAIKVLLMQAGMDYATWANSAEAKAIYLPRFDENKKQIGTYNLISAAALGPTYVAEIENEIEKRYMAKFQPLGTLAMRKEFLFDKIIEYRNAKNQARGLEAVQTTEVQRKRYIHNTLATSANHSTKAFSENFQQLWTITSNDGTGQDPQKAASDLVINFVKAVEIGIIDADKARDIYENAQIYDNSSKKNFSMKDHPVLKGLLQENKFETILHNATVGPIKRQNELNVNNAIVLEDKFRKEIIPEMIKKYGRPFDNQMLIEAQKTWESHPQGGGAGQPFPQALLTISTLEDQNDQSARSLAWAMIRINNGKALNTLQADRLPFHIKKEFEEKGLIRDDLDANDSQLGEARSSLSTYWNESNQSGQLPTNQDGLSSERDEYIRRGLVRYRKLYAKYKFVINDEVEAQKLALADLKLEQSNFHIPEPIGSSIKYITKINQTRTAIKNNSINDTSPNFTTKIDGLDEDIKSLIDIANGKGGRLPEIFFNATRDYSMADGSNAAWAFAVAQYKAYTGKDLTLSDGVTLVRNNTTFSVNDKKVLNNKPNLGGVNRVIIKSEENSGVPSDDKNVSTMTQADIFDIITGSRGDVASDVNIYNVKETTGGQDYTLETLANLNADRGNKGPLGHFQLTENQIRNAAADMDIPLDSKLTIELEQKLWLNRVRDSLLKNNNNFNGLVRKFPALKTLTKDERNRWKALIKGNEHWVVDSVFNRDENLNVKLCFKGEYKRYLNK